MRSVVKIGPWSNGTSEATSYDISIAPVRLESITVRHGWVVDSLAFTYRDRYDKLRTGGPWGSTSGGSTTINLSPSEFLTEVRGAYGLYLSHVDGIADLMFVSNLRSYGPFGTGEGLVVKDRFSIPVKNNSSIVGFFVEAPGYLSGLGVYVKPF